MLKNRNAMRIAVALASIALVTFAASVGFANEGGEGAHHVDKAVLYKDFMWRIVNFVLLAGIIAFGIKKANLKSTLAARTQNIEKELEVAKAGKAAAEAKLAEYTQKIEQASREIDEMYASIVAEGEKEKVRIIAEANESAAKIKAQATLAADQEIAKAKNELRAEAAKLSVELATSKLSASIQKADHDRFVSEYLEKVVQAQ